ncbi:hypothetical protein J6590_002819 [Homalodisca vitripennis]|nr:hypothetical protein J6590_002819 [Homalodisca vitripennis]
MRPVAHGWCHCDEDLMRASSPFVPGDRGAEGLGQKDLCLPVPKSCLGTDKSYVNSPGRDTEMAKLSYAENYQAFKVFLLASGVEHRGDSGCLSLESPGRPRGCGVTLDPCSLIHNSISSRCHGAGASEQTAPKQDRVAETVSQAVANLRERESARLWHLLYLEPCQVVRFGTALVLYINNR